MKFDTLPLFKSHYSLGRSILDLSLPDEERGGPNSIFDLVKEAELKEFFLVDDSMSGFLQAYVNSKELKVQLNFGLRLAICEDMEDKSPRSIEKECKYIILVRNVKGYKKLIKIYTKAAKEGFYYHPRIDFPSLQKYWNDEDLILAVPFYDSFLFRNALEGALCMPDFDFTEPKFFLEDNNLPFDSLIERRVKEFAENKFEIIKVNSIFYKNKEDFKAYLTFRCINGRSTLDKPQLEHMCSDRFSFETWKEKNEKV